MGNHEFCPQCEQSDFHFGRPCDPKDLAEVAKRKQPDPALVEAARPEYVEYVAPSAPLE
jgi:hypothetical protein